MRGKACEMLFEKSGDGITPAYAGKSPLYRQSRNF